jgi:hypothetical protein
VLIRCPVAGRRGDDSDGGLGLATELDGWLEPFVAALGHGKRRRWAPAYLRGLLGPGGRKILQPAAARLGQKGHDQLHHFITSSVWDDGPLPRLLVAKVGAELSHRVKNLLAVVQSITARSNRGGRT